MKTTPPPGGPVYQAVSAQVRALFPADDAQAQAKKKELKGWIGLALAHARTIDNEHRATVGRAQTSTELRETLTAIRDALAGGDAFDDFIAQLNETDDTTAQPHPAQ